MNFNFFRVQGYKKIDYISYFFLISWLVAFSYNFFILRIFNENSISPGWSIFDFTSDRWGFAVDMIWQVFTAGDLNPYLDGRLEGYPPFSHVIFFLVYRLTLILNTLLGVGEKYQIVVPYFLCVSIFICSWILYARKINSKVSLSSAVIFLVFSYPASFLLVRGNSDLYIFPFFLLFLYLYNLNSKLSWFPLSILCSFKPQFGVFLFLYLINTDHKSFLKAVVAIGIIGFLSLLTFNGGLIDNIEHALVLQEKIYKVFGIDSLGVRYGHSFANIYKLALYIFHIDFNIPPYTTLYKFIAFGTSFLILSYIFIYRRKISKSDIFFLLSIIMLSIPYWSSDYKLLIFLPIIFMYIDEIDLPTIFILLLILIPKNYYFYSIAEFRHPMLTISSFLTPFLIFLLMFYIMSKGIINQDSIKTHSTK